MAPGRATDYVAAEVCFTWGLCCSVSLAEEAKWARAELQIHEAARSVGFCIQEIVNE